MSSQISSDNGTIKHHLTPTKTSLSRIRTKIVNKKKILDWLYLRIDTKHVLPENKYFLSTSANEKDFVVYKRIDLFNHRNNTIKKNDPFNHRKNVINI